MDIPGSGHASNELRGDGRKEKHGSGGRQCRSDKYRELAQDIDVDKGTRGKSVAAERDYKQSVMLLARYGGVGGKEVFTAFSGRGI